MRSSRPFELLPKIAFFVSLIVLGGTYGYLSHRHGWWPHSLVVQASLAWKQVSTTLQGEREWYYLHSEETERTRVIDAARIHPGPTLVAFVGDDNHQFVQIIDRDGAVLNEWRVDWFDLWPDSSHLDEEHRPKTLPGAIVHGVLLLKDGGLLVQHDACGLVRLDACGHVVWRLPLRTHHSLHLDERGHIWTSARYTRREATPELPTYGPPFEEYTIVEITLAGEVVQETSLFDLARENDLLGLLHLSTWTDDSIETGRDTLHVNDVEPFPADLTPGHFEPGDVIISFRRLNAVAVFHLPNRSLKHLSVGRYFRQHDPDFIDGDTYSVFDNNPVWPRGRPGQSRIVTVNAATGERRTVFSGSAAVPFYTEFMGKHQWLPNGNLLLVESVHGRVLEVDENGQVVWQFVNVLRDGWLGAVAEGIRVPERFTAEFFRQRRADCSQTVSNN
ncbi:MAG TPA: arylsulfotransferase family protein [Candidatus Synoicihabitans sp.]|nr:arylsulfotransferase family protein [Candidatus Synoicihabitans sp.]